MFESNVKKVIADDNGDLTAVELSVAGEVQTIPADMLLIASGFSGTEDQNTAMFKADTTGKVLQAGDMKNGATLVVLALADGAEAAAKADEMLMGYTSLKR